MNKVYIIEARAEWSQVTLLANAFATLENAQTAVEARFDFPKKISETEYEGRQFMYRIRSLDVL